MPSIAVRAALMRHLVQRPLIRQRISALALQTPSGDDANAPPEPRLPCASNMRGQRQPDRRRGPNTHAAHLRRTGPRVGL